MANDPSTIDVQPMDETSVAEHTSPESKKKSIEAVPSPTFKDDWKAAKEFWQRRHQVFDYNYLTYKSILTYNNVYGEQYLRSFGLQVFVPRTFTVVESIKAQIFSRRIDFTVEGNSFLTKNKAKFTERMDNVEWKRSGAQEEYCDTVENALIFGNGYLENCYVEDKKTMHFPVTKKEKESGPQDPEDGKPQEDTPTFDDKRKIEWEEREVVSYQGMKPKALNPYYVFPDPIETGRKLETRCFQYVPMDVEKAREFVVSKGWLTEEEAKAKVTVMPVEYFDKVRDTIDWLYSMPFYNGYNRGDHVDPQGQPLNKAPERRQENMTALIILNEPDHFEVRCGEDEVLYVDFNIYPHKEIPIIPFFNHKIPGEFPAMGEPEIIRYQQVEENKVHNFTLSTMLMLLVQRFAIHSDAVENENDLSFYDPFKPIRLKSLPGLTVNQAIMALPQPDVKRTPFEMMSLIKETIQVATGASDFIASANDSEAQTATESNNLMAATNGRIKERIREMTASLKNLINQWHTCFYTFYDQEMDLYISGEKTYTRYLPYQRDEANENKHLIEKAGNELNATGMTLEEVYKHAGYDEVIFLSDLMGNMIGDVAIADPDVNVAQTIARYKQVLDLMNEVNKTAAAVPNETQRFDVFRFGKDMLKLFDLVKNPEDYITGKEHDTIKEPAGAVGPGASMPGTPALPPLQAAASTPPANIPFANPS